ncbi:MAG: DUF3419 family protein [Patescibacteria group bacterium]
MNNQVINYSQCWEDTNLLEKSLEINTNDTVLSITSGGDNTLFLLSLNPQKIVSIDTNPVQNYLLELKLAAVKNLSYQDYTEFLGVEKSSNRLETFKKIQNSISSEAKMWWQTRPTLITIGIINIGRFEKFLKLFRNFIMPIIHSKRIILEFFKTDNLESQRNFYTKIWDTWRWRLLFKIFSSRLILKTLARQKGAFKHSDATNVGNIYFQRIQNNLQNIPLKNNYFMHYCLNGYYNKNSLPPYLEGKNKNLLTENKVPIKIVTNDFFTYLRSAPNNYFSKFNLSDIFETLSERENNELWEEIIRTAKNRAVVVYWNNLVGRSYPSNLSKNIFDEDKKADQLYKIDRIPFYGSFHINKIAK